MISQNTYNYSNQQSSLELTLGAKVGNAYVDTGYAGYGLYEATKQLENASKKLEQLIKLKDEGKASQHAVDIAGVAVTMATLNLANSLLQAASSAAGAATAAATSLGTGMYGALYGNVSSSTSEYSSSSSEAVGSNLLSGGDFNFNSNNANITGSVVGSVNGKTTVDISNSLVLTQGENNYSVEQKSHMEQVGMQIGTAGYQPNQITVGFSDHEMEQTNYTKAVILGDGTGVKAGKTDDSQNNLKDYSMIDADSDATMSIDLRVVTKGGRDSIANDIKNLPQNIVQAGKNMLAATTTPYTVAGVLYGAAGPLIESGISQLSSFVSKSFGFTDDAAELAATTMTKDEIVQAGMNNITAEKHIAKAINNLSSTPEKALNSVDNTVDILGELGKKALPDPMNGMSKIVDKAMPDMTLGKSIIQNGSKGTGLLDGGVAEPFFKLNVPKVNYVFENPAIIVGAGVGGKFGGVIGENIGKIIGIRFGLGEISGSVGKMTGTVLGSKIGAELVDIAVNTSTQTAKTLTQEEISSAINLLKI